MKYIYSGQEVELVPGQQFDSHWNVYVNRTDAQGKIVKQILSVDPQVLHSSGSQEASQPQNDSSLSQLEEIKLSINEASFLDIKKKFPGIGRIAAKTISENKPYQSFEDLKRKNSKLNINWDLLKENISYE